MPTKTVTIIIVSFIVAEYIVSFNVAYTLHSLYYVARLAVRTIQTIQYT